MGPGGGEGLASVTGTVWMPGNAPGMVPAGHEIPVFDAVVRLSADRPAAIPPHVYCQQCVEPNGPSTTTAHDGTFSITVIQPGAHWLIIEKGQFRRTLEVTVEAGTQLALTAEQTTLPSKSDYDAGMEIPRIAIGVGAYDQIEDILGKIGLGEVDASGRFVGTSAAGVVDVYANGSYEMDAFAVAPLSALIEDYTRLKQYHIVFVPCSTQTYDSGLGLAGAPPIVWSNLRQFVADGGKLYVTEWSAAYSDNIFPEQIRFERGDTPPSAWDGTSWDPSAFASGASNGASLSSANAYAVDEDLFKWLDGQQGPLESGSVGAIEPSRVEISSWANRIAALEDVQIGVDDKGFPVYDEPRAFIIGDTLGTPSSCAPPGDGCSPLAVTFEPVGCGRVLYSTYHTTSSAHLGLVPEERVLLYLIMEVGVCKSGPIIN